MTDLFYQSLELPAGVITRRRRDKYLFLDPDTPRWVVTNANGALVLKLCDGTKPLQDICRTVSKKLGSDRTGQIENFLRDVITSTGFFSRPEPLVTHASALQVVHLNLTNRCNLQCIYCYACDRKDSKDSLTLEDWQAVIDRIHGISGKAQGQGQGAWVKGQGRNDEATQANEHLASTHGVREGEAPTALPVEGATRAPIIELTGGEPLLAPYVFDVARYARGRGNRVHLLSNGLLIDEETIEPIVELFDLIRISLDGSGPEPNDYHRGEGTFDKISKALEMLVRRDAPVEVSMTVTKRNIGDVHNMVRKFGSLVSFAPLFNAGRAKVNRRLAITGKEYYRALSSVDGVNPLNCLHAAFQRARGERIMKCAMGDAEISVSNTGDVYPCHLLHLPQFLAGNVKKEPLENIYRNSTVLMSLRRLNVLGIEGCATCEVRFICGGACRARAFYEKNRIDVSDDFCEYEKLAYSNGLFELHQLE